MQMSASKIGVGVQDTPKFYVKIVFRLINLLVEKQLDQNGKQVFSPIDPLGNLEIQIADETFKVILLFIFLRSELTFFLIIRLFQKSE